MAKLEKNINVLIALAIIVVALFGIALAVGITQTAQNDPTRGCVQFHTGTTFRGYHCVGGDVYIPAQ